MKLEEFILKQLYILGAVGIGIAFLQVKRRPLNKKFKFKFNTDLKVHSKHLCFWTLTITLFSFFPASGDNIYLLSLSEFGRRSLLISEFYILKKGTCILNLHLNTQVI